VSEGIHRLTQGVANFYLIGESGKYTVIDAGTPGDWAFFARSLAGLGAKLADVDAVLLTHAHPDHTGFAERARAEAGAQVWIHRADEQAARRSCSRTAGSWSPATSWPRRTRSPAGSARRSCRTG
jgi:glyoxylase-like metal-dependent hydrolase (beta-lactamase superfamily II)